MPEFNQAFIKAFQQRPRSPAGGAPAPHHELTPPVEVASDVPAASEARPEAPRTPAQPIFRLEPATAVPAPHLRFPLVGNSGKKRAEESAPSESTLPTEAPPIEAAPRLANEPSALPVVEPPATAMPPSAAEPTPASPSSGSTDHRVESTPWDELLTVANAVADQQRPAAAVRPLSDFASPPKVETFRPALEVPYFLWPEICRTIVAGRGEHLARLSQTLAALGDGARVAITSRERGEGRTTLVASLAAYLAQHGTTCCLIDADFARPQLARRLGVQPQVGWEEVLTGQVPLTEALVESGRDRCALLPLANPQPSDVQLLGKLEAAVDLGVLGEYYSLVLLDAGPWEGSSAVAMQTLCRQGAIDALLIVADRRRPDHDLATLADDLQATGVGLVGIVENFTSACGGTGVS
jgi:Mrp family chromosome partitioning ATPase